MFISCELVSGNMGTSGYELYSLLASDIMCLQNFSMQSGPLYCVVGFLTFPYANLECKHQPEGLCEFTPIVEETFGLFLTPWIGSSIDSKSAYIMKGTLN